VVFIDTAYINQYSLPDNILTHAVLFHRTRRGILNKKQNTTEAATRLFARPGFKIITVFQPIKNLSDKELKDLRCQLASQIRGSV